MRFYSTPLDIVGSSAASKRELYNTGNDWDDAVHLLNDLTSLHSDHHPVAGPSNPNSRV